MNILQNESGSNFGPFVGACAASCKKLVGKIQSIKAAILAEFRQGASDNGRMLQLALNEAEALAHETGYPHLFFPTLAREKVEAVAAWNLHQRGIRRADFAAA